MYCELKETLVDVFLFFKVSIPKLKSKTFPGIYKKWLIDAKKTTRNPDLLISFLQKKKKKHSIDENN